MTKTKYRIVIRDNLEVIKTITGYDKQELLEVADNYIWMLDHKGHDCGGVEYNIQEWVDGRWY